MPPQQRWSNENKALGRGHSLEIEKVLVTDTRIHGGWHPEVRWSHLCQKIRRKAVNWGQCPGGEAPSNRWATKGGVTKGDRKQTARESYEELGDASVLKVDSPAIQERPSKTEQLQRLMFPNTLLLMLFKMTVHINKQIYFIHKFLLILLIFNLFIFLSPSSSYPNMCYWGLWNMITHL